MNLRTARLDRLPIPQSTSDSARAFARIGARLLGDTCIVSLADGATLVPLAVHDHDSTAVGRVASSLELVPLDRYAIVRNALASGEPAAAEVDEGRARRGEPTFLGGIFHSFLVVPVHPLIGVVVFARHRGERSRFHREHIALAVELADVIASDLESVSGAGLGTGLLN